MSEHPHKRFQDLSPKAERAWEPSEDSATNASAVESPIASKEVPQPQPETADISPAREHLMVPDRKGSTVQERRHSLGFSLALHLAVGTTWLSLPEPQPNTPDLTRLDGQERLDALGDTIEARLLRMAETDEHNREVRAQLERERHAYFDRLIETTLNPESPEYKSRYGIPSIDAFAHIDALTHVEQLIKPYQAQKLDAKRVAELVQEYEANLLARHKENMDVLFAHGYEWTGNVRTDFPTLQEALFQGDDRYFYNPGFSQTLYRQDQEQFDKQLTTGIVNCQVARMTPMVLYDIYERADLPKDDLAHVRQTTWAGHAFSGYENPSTQERFTLMEGVFGTPEWPGTHPPSAEEPGVLRSPADHLAYYLHTHDAMPEQLEQLARMGYGLESLPTFSSIPMPDGTFSFGSYEELVAGDRHASERITQEHQTESHVDLEPVIEDTAKADVLQAFHQYIKAHPVEGGSSAQGAGVVTLPAWLRSPAAREILPDYVALNYDSETMADVYRALVLDGARSRDLLERIRGRFVEDLKVRLEKRSYPDMGSGFEQWLDITNTWYMAGPFGPSVFSSFKNEPWFFDSIDTNIEDKTRAFPIMQGDSFLASSIASQAVTDIALLDALAQEETREHGTQETNPFAERARRLEQALIPYQDTVEIHGFMPSQIASMPRQQLRDVIARSSLFNLVARDNEKLQEAYFDRLANDPDLYVFTLELLAQFEYAYSYRRSISPFLRLGESAYQNTRLRPRIESATRDILQQTFDRLESPNENDSYALSALLALHHENLWLRPIIEAQLRRTHEARPLSDFNIHYAGLQRFGLKPAKDTLPHGGARALIDYLTDQDDRNTRQFMDTRNVHIDRVFSTAYLLCDQQQDRLELLWAFSLRTHLPPPVHKDQLFPEDLAVISALSNTDIGPPDRLIIDLKPYYAPQTIDIVHELRQNPADPNLYRYRDWAEMNPNLGLQYVEQWIAFEQARETPVAP